MICCILQTCKKTNTLLAAFDYFLTPHTFGGHPLTGSAHECAAVDSPLGMVLALFRREQSDQCFYVLPGEGSPISGAALVLVFDAGK
ncbi:hypothetical protein EBQ90_11145 [bacterium]|nr:hypothetical protein [bacterium]